jgi:ribosome maturation factor RimP
MIDKNVVIQLVEERIVNTDIFIVSVDIDPGNKIKIVLDGLSGLTIEQCVSVSRNVEHNLDREIEDFSLEVSSYGLGRPLILPAQFIKNIDQMVEVQDIDQQKFKGILSSYSENKIELKLELSKKQIKEGVNPVKEMLFEQIKEVKSVISFK